MGRERERANNYLQIINIIPLGPFYYRAYVCVFCCLFIEPRAKQTRMSFHAKQRKTTVDIRLLMQSAFARPIAYKHRQISTNVTHETKNIFYLLLLRLLLLSFGTKRFEIRLMRFNMVSKTLSPPVIWRCEWYTCWCEQSIQIIPNTINLALDGNERKKKEICACIKSEWFEIK